VHEEVRDVDFFAKSVQAGGICDITLSDFTARSLEMCCAGGIAYEAADLCAVGEQSVG
jgi:hypothetical protein